MASTDSKALDSLDNRQLLTLYQQRWPSLGVPPVLKPELLPEEQRHLLISALSADEPVLEWQRYLAPDAPTY
jgi:hypothetical protein